MKNSNNSKQADMGFLLQKAVQCFQAGNLKKSAALISKIIKATPSHADANFLMGLIYAQREKFSKAIENFSTAINTNPNDPRYHHYLSRVLHKKGLIENALEASKQSIKLDPQFAEAHNQKGNILWDMGTDYYQDALLAYEQATNINAAYADAHGNRSVVLREFARLDEALTACKTAIRINPDNAELHRLYGDILCDMGSDESALPAFDKAIQIDASYALALNHKASALIRLCSLEEALITSQRSVEVNPDDKVARINIALIMESMGSIDDCEIVLRDVLALQSDQTAAHSYLLSVLAARATLSPEKMLEELCLWDSLHGKEGRKHLFQPRVKNPMEGRRLRIGYISQDLYSHSVTHFFEPLLGAHDKEHFEIFCYAAHSTTKSDKVTEQLQAFAEHWRIVDNLDDIELSKLINKDNIDILVDLSGHTAGNRLSVFTYKPAPVQTAYLGFLASTGLAAMDYWITDEVLHPPDTLEKTSEKIYRLPRCWVCYRPPIGVPTVSPCPNNDNNVVLGSFSAISKLSDDVIETWSQLLKELPGSRLLVMDKYLGDTSVQQQLLVKFKRHDIGPERLLLRAGLSYFKYFSTYGEVDIVLDPFPRTGGTTTAEALWMGVPVVTLAGQRYAERISASKLMAVGLEKYITYTREEYIDAVVSLAHDPAGRNNLRENLREMMTTSPLCDSRNLARALESAYQNMWQHYLDEDNNFAVNEDYKS